MPGRNLKTNSFQKRRTEFETKVNLNKEQCITTDTEKFWEELVAYVSLIRHGLYRERKS
jgi:hypothetical protein